jgi:hypothetical protein
MSKLIITTVLTLLLLSSLCIDKTYAHTDELTFSSYTVGESITITSSPKHNVCDPPTFPKQLHHANIQQFKNNNGEYILDFSNATISFYKNGEVVDGFLYVANEVGVVWFAQHTADSNTIQTTEFDDDLLIVANGVKVVRPGVAYMGSNITYTSAWEVCYLINGSQYPDPIFPHHEPSQARVAFVNPTPIPTAAPTPTNIPTPLPTPTAVPTITPVPTSVPTPTPRLRISSKVKLFDFGIPSILTFTFKNDKPLLSPSPTPQTSPTPTSTSPTLSPTQTPQSSPTPTPTLTPTTQPLLNTIISLKVRLMSLFR